MSNCEKVFRSRKGTSYILRRKYGWRDTCSCASTEVLMCILAAGNGVHWLHSALAATYCWYLNDHHRIQNDLRHQMCYPPPRSGEFVLLSSITAFVFSYYWNTLPVTSLFHWLFNGTSCCGQLCSQFAFKKDHAIFSNYRFCWKIPRLISHYMDDQMREAVVLLSSLYYTAAVLDSCKTTGSHINAIFTLTFHFIFLGIME